MDTLQHGKTRWSHYQIAYHFVWIPKYRRKVLTDEVAAVVKRSIEDLCRNHGFQLLALETDIDHVHCFVSAPPKDAPSKIVGLLKGYKFAHRPSGVSGAGKAHRPRSTVDQRVLRRHRRASQRRNHPALHHTMPRTVAACQPPASHPPAKAQGNSRRLFKR